jgi:hypothetical protein
MNNTWHVEVVFETNKTFPLELSSEMIEQLEEYAAVVSPERDGSGGRIAMTVDGKSTIMEATSVASDAVRKALKPLVGAVDILGLEVSAQEVFEKKMNEPVFPEVVGYAEIADLAGVSRQRARQFTIARGFPTPVITTGQGPLMDRAAVLAWLKNRNTKAGRPKSLTKA